nr:LysR family transcriptional regulator [Serratia marcescens]
MDKLSAMKTFMRVAELGSLSAAARDLRLTQPAVSQQIAALEQRLGAQLLFRSTRAVTLTDAGSGYYQRLKPILAAVDEAEERCTASATSCRAICAFTPRPGSGSCTSHRWPSLSSSVIRTSPSSCCWTIASPT